MMTQPYKGSRSAGDGTVNVRLTQHGKSAAVVVQSLSHVRLL